MYLFNNWFYYDLQAYGNKVSIRIDYYLSKRKCSKCGRTESLQKVGPDEWKQIDASV